MSVTSDPLNLDVLVTEELVSIVIRASQLGYSAWRVGIALRVAPMELAWICARLNEQDAQPAELIATLRGASLHPSVRRGPGSPTRLLDDQPL